MKRKITLLLLAAGSLFTMNSQVTLTEDFTDPFPIGTNGWSVIDNTSPLNTLSWTQGNQTGGNGIIPAFNGNFNDFYMADFTAVNSISSPGTISAFLITPTVNIYNGCVLQFATRTANQTPPNIYPDRMQVLMSQTGNTTTLLGSTTNVGSFTDKLLDINPNLVSVNASAVTNGSVNGYPFNWVVYTIPVSGVTGTVTGRFAFRYFVTNGGQAGANSRLVGVDAVRFTEPCGATVPSYTICAGNSVTLQATGGISTTTYSWNTTATSSSIVVNPASTTVYTLYPAIASGVGGGACAAVTATVTVSGGFQMSILPSATSQTICAGETVTLSAVSAANTYTWGIGATPITIAPTVTVAPSVTTIYSVAAQAGGCLGLSSIQITVKPTPTVSISASSTIVCVSGPSVGVSFTGNGASTYFWVASGGLVGIGSNFSFPVAAQTAITPGIQTAFIDIFGTDPNGCQSIDVFTLTIAKAPSVTITPAVTGTVCTSSTITLTGDGADTYTWTGATTSTENPLSYVTPTVAGSKVFTLTGMDATTGCTNKKTYSQQVVLCNVNLAGINAVNGYEETAIFPNPFTNEIKINVLEGNVVIYNSLGQVVINTPIDYSGTINTTELPKGAYVVKAYNTRGEEVKTSRLIKN